MKKILLSLAVFAAGYSAQAQVVFSGVSPAAVVGNYDFTTQVNEGIWPGETDDGTWNVSAPDFTLPGTFIQDTLMLVEDGTPGTNPQGNPVSQEGCNPLTNDLTGKIAVIYRNTCSFSDKILNAQNAGAIACIIVNREDALIGMSAAASGVNVTIPAIFVSSVTGGILINEMAAGPVVVFIGNKIGVHANDMGSYREDIMVAPFATNHQDIINGFDLGIQLYNYGSNVQASGTVTAEIVGPGATTLYSNTVTLPSLNTADTAFVFNGNAVEFPRFDLGVGNYPVGDYTLTYTIDLGIADDDPVDNVFVSTFSVTTDQISMAHQNGTGGFNSGSYPTPADFSEYKTCMFYVDSNTNSLAVEGVYFTPHSEDLALDPINGAEFNISIEEWNDVWIDATDPNIYSGLDSLVQVSFAQYYPSSDAENETSIYVPLPSPLSLVNNQRYLVCAQSLTDNISFGYDTGNDYSANAAIYLQPNNPLFINSLTNNQWFSGWTSGNAPSIGLKTGYVGLNEIEGSINGRAFPNPSGNNVTIAIDANGSAELSITDLSGRVAMTENITLVNGQSGVDVSTLDAGLYIFNVTLENGQTSQFNVVKK